MKNIAVLLTVYNRKKETLNCLQQIYNQHLNKEYNIDVYLINDGCTDGTPDLVQQLYPNVKIINSEGDLFWNRGMHLAWSIAAKKKEYNFYLWLNDDTQLKNNALNILLETSAGLDDQSIVIGSTHAIQNNMELTYGGRSLNQGLILPKNEIIACDYFNGNIVLIPEFVYKKVGMNDPIFHHALGDFDYGLRARKKGVTMYIAPGFLGACDAHESLATWCNPNKTFKQRVKAFRSPLGNNPEEHYIYEKRHYGTIIAVFHYFTNHLRVVFPSLWDKKIKP
ncbi:glycosyltransferase family 2 protein [Wenyingzhuangia sp. 2_MG-2023]|uniref:glycosyltransferase family 2 protein n=1 Tax=Wenyingzhuangia sp. 2_MG-2023 TaxID=3062639 RepID=UPI0026E1732D|nr:glycosyltransferase family 2 protein [Wenyingzhuangia sp. 2_MG-2023]MDO6739090.1 glycosyltransferase family 2 protein [Wenyingzhuangia sp. 2_MG-2023]